MNLLCPNCQKMLTVPEQYAGQLMKCPLCAGTFTVPALPGAPNLEPPPPPLPPTGPATVEPMPSAPAGAEPGAAAAGLGTVPTPTPTGDYTKTCAMYFSPRVLPWVVAGSVVLIFILQFFPWVGVYPGGVPAVTQNAWGAAFGSFEPDPDMKEAVDLISSEKERPGASVLAIFYLLLFIPALLLTIGALLLGMGVIPVPAALQNLMPWRWGLVAVFQLILFFFLGLQAMLGFSIESRWAARVDETLKTKEAPKTDMKKKLEAARGIALEQVDRTFAFRLAMLLQLVTLVSAGLMHWVSRRPAGAAIPRMALQW
jgi:hypothetical protein